MPSLPAVAMQVIELTSDPDVSMGELARTIQADQALAAKILRTVNSSFYGLRQPCGTIDKALVMLGLNPVKSLVLGFSLVSAIGTGPDADFDYEAYWRRGLFTGIGARQFAAALKSDNADEAFLGGMLQDIGMMAMFCTFGDDYVEVLKQTNGDHRKLTKYELDAFEIHHPDVGALLCRRWRLPDELTLPVRFHERPTAAPQECVPLVHHVALGNLVHDVLTDEDPVPALRKLYERANAWFSLSVSEVDEVVSQVTGETRDMASLLELDTGSYKDAEEIVQKAGKQLVEISRNAGDGASVASSASESPILAKHEFDPLTGSLSAEAFEQSTRHSLAIAATSGEPVSILQVAVDRFANIIENHGPVVGDEILIGMAVVMKKMFEPAGGIVCRIARETFGVVLPDVGSVEANRLIETMFAEITRANSTWELPEGVTVTASAGLATSATDGDKPTTPGQLVLGAFTALRAARAAGGSTAKSADLVAKAA
ncbi:MAG: GGDEF domain-containing protein [Planctomycetota bacterium]